jgi:ABC-type uncharacterized transport system permease subunit
MNSYPLIFLFTEQNGANCNPLHAFPNIITNIITMFSFFPFDSCVYWKPILERKAYVWLCFCP